MLRQTRQVSERPDNPFEPRLGRIRSDGSLRRGRTFLSRVARSVSRSGHAGPAGRRGAGRNGKRTYGRRVVVKARFVRLSMSSARALGEHLRYISRDDAMRPEDRGQVFNGESDAVDRDAFADAASEDRHHFRVIVSPEDGAEFRDMKPFVRDLVADMETDLGTRLDWVAAIHDNTDYPHAHIVIRGRRDDGRDLVMPRAYISHGIRERAETLATLELGPQTELERDAKLFRQTGAQHLTQIDRALARQMSAGGEVDLQSMPAGYRGLNMARLRTLERFGLASRRSGTIWRMSEGFDVTLKELGERADIIKQIHRALDRPEGRRVQAAPVFDDAANGAGTLAGRIVKKGLGGEGHDQPFLIMDGMDGRVVRVGVANRDLFEHLRKDMIVSLSKHDLAPKPSDMLVARIAQQNRGLYREDLHRAADPTATSGFIAAHVRRLEALRRRGLVKRDSDGIWSVPDGFLTEVEKSNHRKFGRDLADVEVASWVGLKKQIEARGLGWLDTADMPEVPAYGFGEETRVAAEQRRQILQERGLIPEGQDRLDSEAKRKLQMDVMSKLGADTSAANGKTYEPLPGHGQISGRYTGTIDRAEGRFAVIERERTFTLAPWRAVLERQRGKAVAGMVRSGAVSWTFGRKRGPGV